MEDVDKHKTGQGNEIIMEEKNEPPFVATLIRYFSLASKKLAGLMCPFSAAYQTLKSCQLQLRKKEDDD